VLFHSTSLNIVEAPGALYRSTSSALTTEQALVLATAPPASSSSSITNFRFVVRYIVFLPCGIRRIYNNTARHNMSTQHKYARHDIGKVAQRPLENGNSTHGSDSTTTYRIIQLLTRIHPRTSRTNKQTNKQTER